MTIAKKFINDPENIPDQTVKGYLAAQRRTLKKVGDGNVLVARELPDSKIGVLIGGGIAAEPLFLGYVGKNMADCAVIGNVNAAPSPLYILEGSKTIDQGKGVLYIYNNYSGDAMSFDMAAELAQDENIQTQTVKVCDDVGSSPIGTIYERNGIMGAIYVIKIAGSASSEIHDLVELQRVVSDARDSTRSLIVAARSGYYLESGELMFQLPENTMNIATGLHGGPGLFSSEIKSADETVDIALEILLKDLDCQANDEVAVMVNSMGATSITELFILNHRIDQVLRKNNIAIHHTDVGFFYTSQDMVGFSITLMKLNNELKRYFDLPADSFSYKRL